MIESLHALRDKLFSFLKSEEEMVQRITEIQLEKFTSIINSGGISFPDASGSAHSFKRFGMEISAASSVDDVITRFYPFLKNGIVIGNKKFIVIELFESPHPTTAFASTCLIYVETV